MAAAHIGDIIASTRILKGFSQKELAKKLSISAAYLSSIENGSKKPSTKLLFEIAAQLNTTVSRLLFDTLKENEKISMEQEYMFRQLNPLFEKMLSALLQIES